MNKQTLSRWLVLVISLLIAMNVAILLNKNALSSEASGKVKYKIGCKPNSVKWTYENIESLLNQYGEQGWHLVYQQDRECFVFKKIL